MKHETESGAEFISPTHLRHVMRYVSAANLLSTLCLNKQKIYVLDAACGTGYGSSILCDILSAIPNMQLKILGLDFSDEALSYAKQHYLNDNISFEKHSLLSFVDDRKFDVVVSIETIEHFSRKDIDLYLNSLLNVLNKDGTLFISTPYCEQSGPSPVTPQHLYEFNIDELQDLLKSKGLKILSVKLNKKPGKAGRLGYAEVVCIK